MLGSYFEGDSLADWLSAQRAWGLAPVSIWLCVISIGL